MLLLRRIGIPVSAVLLAACAAQEQRDSGERGCACDGGGEESARDSFAGEEELSDEDAGVLLDIGGCEERVFLGTVEISKVCAVTVEGAVAMYEDPFADSFAIALDVFMLEDTEACGQELPGGTDVGDAISLPDVSFFYEEFSGEIGVLAVEDSEEGTVEISGTIFMGATAEWSAEADIFEDEDAFAVFVGTELPEADIGLPGCN